MKKAFAIITLVLAVLLAVSCSTTYQSREVPADLLEYEQFATPYKMSKDGQLHFYFVAASNGYVRTSSKTGDACLILFPNGETMLIDCCVGSYASVLITSLLKMGVTDINYLVMTHPHSDHAGGIYNNKDYSILDYFNVGKFFYTGIDTSVTTKTLDKLEAHDIPCELLLEGDEMDIGGVHLSVINPPKSVVGTSSSEEEYLNSSSITIRFDYGEFSALFTGDLYIPGEYRLVDEHSDLLDVDLLKVCHHGRSTSSCERFIEAVSPSLAVVTGNCPMDTVIYKVYKENNCEVLFDFCDGYVHAWSDGKTLSKEHSLVRNITIYD